MDLKNKIFLQDAIDNYKKKNFSAAKILLLKILDTEPQNFDSLNIIGVIYGKENKHKEALNFFKKAQKIRPDNKFINFNLAKAFSEIGNDLEAINYYKIAIRLDKNNFDSILNFAKSLYHLKKYDEALFYYDQAIKLKPDYPEAYNNKGLTLNNLQRYDEALLNYDQAIKLKPDYANVYVNKGLMLYNLKQYDKSLFNYNEAIKLNPYISEAYNNKGLTLNNLQRYDEALLNYDQAIKLKPDYPEAYNNKGLTLNNLQRYDEALLNYDQAIKLKPDYSEAYYNKGLILYNLKQYDKSLFNYNQAIKLKPDYPEAYNNKGLTLNNLQRYDEALLNYDQAIKLKPDYASAYNNKGLTLNNLQRYDEALLNYDQAIKLKPDFFLAYFNKSLIKLILCDFQNGWELYQYRWKKIEFERYSHIAKLNSIKNLKNKKVLIWHEQGMGDTIQFSRYISKLIDLGAEVTFEVQLDLVPFFKDQFDKKIKEILFKDSNDHFDFHAPLMDLPYLFNTSIDNIPLSQGYLKVQDRNKIIHWKEILKLSKDKLNIGIAVSGNPDFELNSIRSIPLIRMEKLFKNGNFFIVQKELNNEDMKFLRDYKGINFLGDKINNFSDTAAIIENMDLIISINTSLIHLAGAIGKKSFLMLNWSSEWRWSLDSIDSPWYESVKIFRQKSIGDWDSVINQIQLEFNNLKLKS